MRSKGLNHVKSITMTHMLNLLLCRVEGDKFQKWLQMLMFFTCSTYWLAVGEGINEYKNDSFHFVQIFNVIISRGRKRHLKHGSWCQVVLYVERSVFVGDSQEKHNNDSRFQIGWYVERSVLKGMGGDGGSTFKLQNNDSTCQLCSYITGTALYFVESTRGYKLQK